MVKWSWRNVLKSLRRLCTDVLARSDVAWSELLAKKMSLAELQAYITLRGSRLTGDDKTRILVESGGEGAGELKMHRVAAAARMLGFSFFKEYAYGKKDKTLRTIKPHLWVRRTMNMEMNGQGMVMIGMMMMSTHCCMMMRTLP